MTVTTIDHPLIQHKLTLMRDKDTSSSKFRTLLEEISHLLAYEVTRDFPLTMHEIETPMQKTQAPLLTNNKVILVSILRAGTGILNGMLQLIPTAKVGHIGLYRDPKTHVIIEYYFKLPQGAKDQDMIVVDPMLATGHSAIAAISRLKTAEPRSVKFVCLIAAPQGLELLQEKHPDVPIYTAAVDETLNDNGYILPGIGDAGDRIFGTK